MKKSYWILFSLAILCPFLVGVSFLMKYKEIAHYEKLAYLSVGLLIVFIGLAVKELLLLFNDLKSKD